ncbi:DJ-1/PfpI family protein [Phenylobacterium sp.]|uniref:DJ-1/PfpI family protein n=1 Tax=Phenylobacterium sp. TaxID=1871053 RepID=UPI0035B4272A
MRQVPIQRPGKAVPCPSVRAGGIAVLVAVLALAGSPRAAWSAPPPGAVDFDAAMASLKFKPESVDANADAKAKPNGLIDADEMALVSAVLDGPAKAGPDRAAVEAAWRQADASATADMAKLAKAYPQAHTVAAGYAMLGHGSLEAFSRMSAAFGAPLKSDYSQALALARYFAAEGDADGDGVSNRDEYAAFIGQGRAAYVRAALDPAVKPGPGAATALAIPVQPARKVVGVVLYPGFELLDVFGPVEMWANVPEFEVVMIAEKAGPVRSAQGVEVIATRDFASTPKIDILMTPGGIGTYEALENPRLLDFLRAQDKSVDLMTSVCTGSAILAKAGLLHGRNATSNKAFFKLATDQDPGVTWVRKARWVEDGKYVTSSGVSAGTDMALGVVARLYGQERARLLAKSLEYQWSEDPSSDPFALP